MTPDKIHCLMDKISKRAEEQLHLSNQYFLILFSSAKSLVCYTAVFSVVTQRSSPLREEHCVTTRLCSRLPKVWNRKIKMSFSHDKSVSFISKCPLQVPFHELPRLTVKSEECFEE